MVGERLAELREHKALTLHELEELSGVGADGISKIENGRRKPRPSTLRKLARALGAEVEDFFKDPVFAGKAEAPQETGQLSASEEASVLEGLAAAVDSVADRIQRRSEQTGEDTNGEELTALFEDAWLAQRGADQLLEEVNEQAVRKQEETPGERRARSTLEGAVMRLVILSEEITSGLLEETEEQKETNERTKVLFLDEERRRRRAG